MNNSAINTSSFLLLVKKELIDNRKALLLGVGALWICCILIGALLGFNGRGGGEGEVMIFAFMFGAFGCIAASVAFSDMKSKVGRISAIMLPATAFEKFIVRWIAVVPILFGLMIAGFYIGDLTRIFVSWVADVPIPYGTSYHHITNPWTALYFHNGMLNAIMITGYLSLQAPFFFGAILWPKLSLIKTIAALWIIQIIIGIFMVTIPWSSMLYHIYDNTWAAKVQTTILVTNIIISLGFYFLTYWRFKRSQVTYKLF